MKRRMLAVSFATAAAAAAALTLGAGASASAAGSPTAALSSLTLSIVPVSPSTGSGPDQVTLECDPTGGTHPDAAAACKELTAVNGEFKRLPNAPGLACPTYYDPVTAVAVGNWRGIRVSYQETFTNRCFAEVGTALVFQF